MTTDTEPMLVPEMEKRIRRLENEFDQMIRKAESTEVRIRKRLAAFKSDFDTKRGALHARMDEAREVNAAASEEMSSGLETAWNELSDAFNAARSEYLKLL